MRAHILLLIILCMTGNALQSAEEKLKAPQLIVIKDEKSFEVHFKDQVSKQMMPQILSAKAESLEQALPLIGNEAHVIFPFRFMTAYKEWFLFSDGEGLYQAKETDAKDADPISIFYSGYAIKKGTDKLVLFGWCW